MKRINILLLMLTLLFTLAACNTNEEKATPNENEVKQETTENEKEEAADSITVEHVLGTATFEEAPKKVVVLEWVYAENLLALGVQPVGVADIEGYKAWVKVDAELSADVVDVGTRQEPNLEAIAQLQPDLIIAPKFRHEAIKAELEGIAPTLFFEPYPTDESISQYDEMVSTFQSIAKALDKEAEAENLLNGLNKKYEEAKASIEKASLSTNEFVLTQAYSSQQTPVLRVFTPNAMASVIFEKIGLKNAYVPENFEVYGFSQLNVEALPALEAANFFYVVQDNDNIFENQLKDNAVWKNLDFVKSNRMYPLGGDAWLFGGPLSAETVVDRVLAVVEQK
ncbi:ABC transporter substrate-binding protein [Bacillus salitolerans]|uniref:ABC transporter substrate-binding protein n=1 Tax=Bacillus salitolerans TaxID=1437434 RepID=A0ABW4LXD9_9BACI